MAFGADSSADFDVIVIGGGPAGLSAAIYLGRSRRRTLVVDSGRPRNAASPAAHGVFTRDGASPASLLADARRQVGAYSTVAVRQDEAVSVEALTSSFRVRLASSAEVKGRRLLLACGIRDELPAINGISRLWGTGVLHCAYCHGYEVSDRPIALVARGDVSVGAVATLLQLSQDLVLCTNGPSDLQATDRRRLADRNVRIIEQEILTIEGESPDLALHFANGSVLRRAAVFVRTTLKPGSDLPMQLGCRFEQPYRLAVGVNCETTVRGVYAAGDLATKDQIAIAVASGAQAAIAINGDLIQEDLGGPWTSPVCGADTGKTDA